MSGACNIFVCREMIYQHVCPLQQRINGKYYTTTFKQLLMYICRKCPELVNNWILHQDMMPPCKACCIKIPGKAQHCCYGNLPPHTHCPDFAPVQLLVVPYPEESLKKSAIYSDLELLTATRSSNFIKL